MSLWWTSMRGIQSCCIARAQKRFFAFLAKLGYKMGSMLFLGNSGKLAMFFLYVFADDRFPAAWRPSRMITDLSDFPQTCLHTQPPKPRLRTANCRALANPDLRINCRGKPDVPNIYDVPRIACLRAYLATLPLFVRSES